MPSNKVSPEAKSRSFLKFILPLKQVPDKDFCSVVVVGKALDSHEDLLLSVVIGLHPEAVDPVRVIIILDRSSSCGFIIIKTISHLLPSHFIDQKLGSVLLIRSENAVVLPSLQVEPHVAVD
jgi:hypothetical protein